MPIPPSIFNDVIGPVMRGPSSSHCAAALRIGRLARDLMAGRIERVLLELDSRGSLATTHADQGSDMGLFGGLLGWEPWDERLVDAAAAIREAGIEVDIRIDDFTDPHPNTYRLTLSSRRETHHMIVLSTGGGMIEVRAIDEVPLALTGDRFETILSVPSVSMDLHEFLRETVAADEVLLHTANDRTLIEITGRQPLPDSVLSRLAAQEGVGWVRTLAPVLPVLADQDTQVPFVTCGQMLEWNQERRLDLAGLAVAYESARGGIPEQEAEDRMLEIVRLLRRSIAQGLQGTRWEDRILGDQSAAFRTGMEKGRLLDAGMLNAMILYATALMEVKSSMGVIVAAPTAGACGALPAAVIAAAEAMGRPEADMARALLAAGLIGVFICAQSTFAAEVCGCQAECGAGSGMAAAALVTLAGGNAEQAADAGSMALQNILGLVCDPVANRVEVPCLGRNVLAVSNALACANMALAGFDAVIPLDEVIAAMDHVGKSLPPELRCTGLGGLATTPAGRAVAERLKGKSSS